MWDLGLRLQLSLSLFSGLRNCLAHCYQTDFGAAALADDGSLFMFRSLSALIASGHHPLLHLCKLRHSTPCMQRRRVSIRRFAYIGEENGFGAVGHD